MVPENHIMVQPQMENVCTELQVLMALRQILENNGLQNHPIPVSGIGYAAVLHRVQVPNVPVQAPGTVRHPDQDPEVLVSNG